MRPVSRILVAGAVVLVTVWFYLQLAGVPHLRDLLHHGAPVQQQDRIQWGDSSEIVDGFLEDPTKVSDGAVVASEVVIATTMTPDATTRIEEEVSGVTHAVGSSETVETNDLETTEISSAVGAIATTTHQDATNVTPPLQTNNTSSAAETAASMQEEPSTPTLLNAPGRKDKVVVMGALSYEDTTWAATKLQDWDSVVYIVDNDTAPVHTTLNKGREANAYLSYILDNYNDLPATIAFVHSHEKGYPKAWHTDTRHHSNVDSLNMLNTAFVQENGYANLRCVGNPGCPDEVQPFRSPVDPERTTEAAFPEAWRFIFGNDHVPSVVGVACCAQFAVSRRQVLERTLEEYRRMHQWLMETELNDDTSGRVFEYLWHIIFGQEAVYCPGLRQCYNDVYGRDWT